MKPNLKLLLAEKGLRLTDLVKSLGVHKSLATRWDQGRVPVERAVQIERATGIPRHKLRPDVFEPPTAFVGLDCDERGAE